MTNNRILLDIIHYIIIYFLSIDNYSIIDSNQVLCDAHAKVVLRHMHGCCDEFRLVCLGNA